MSNSPNLCPWCGSDMLKVGMTYGSYRVTHIDVKVGAFQCRSCDVAFVLSPPSESRDVEWAIQEDGSE